MACWLATTTPQISAKQDIYLAKIVECESGGNETIKVVDSNGYYSYGAFQFQKGTFLSQSDLYSLGYTDKDIFDYRKQKYLAHLMLKDGGEGHWYNCTKNLGKYPK